ncbi:hypothetical protein EYF80_061430 [Liparis tanakae]|uniref:Uncharacterized protein n=1 Tax=Liparis tanakae TaxID=230148 RepID=A0A4Z2EIH8_9TELE|nr:hypothetical protein EYF80_061430 [Liparis tanakae]
MNLHIEAFTGLAGGVVSASCWNATDPEVLRGTAPTGTLRSLRGHASTPRTAGLVRDDVRRAVHGLKQRYGNASHLRFSGGRTSPCPGGGVQEDATGTDVRPGRPSDRPAPGPEAPTPSGSVGFSFWTQSGGRLQSPRRGFRTRRRRPR